MQADRVDRVEACELTLVTAPWPYATRHSAAIDAHWAKRTVENPGFFNGAIHISRSASVQHRRLEATMAQTDFKSFLYWREHGYRSEADARDTFGSAIVRSAEGAVLLGRQRPGRINDGLTYLPGGFIDARDVESDGRVDIEASIARELGEETGLAVEALRVRPGFLVTQCGAQLSIGQELVSDQPADVLRATILAYLATDPDPELADIVIVRTLSDSAAHPIPPYTRLALAAVFGGI